MGKPVKPVIRLATPGDAREVAGLIGELNCEIMSALGKDRYTFDQARTMTERAEFLEAGDYAIILATSLRGHPLGFVTLFGNPQHRGDPFGTLAELYVRPDYRRQGVGHRLIERAKSHGRSLRWRQLQLTLPAFARLDAAPAFLDSERFADAGGKKRKLSL